MWLIYDETSSWRGKLFYNNNNNNLASGKKKLGKNQNSVSFAAATGNDINRKVMSKLNSPLYMIWLNIKQTSLCVVTEYFRKNEKNWKKNLLLIITWSSQRLEN